MVSLKVWVHVTGYVALAILGEAVQVKLPPERGHGLDAKVLGEDIIQKDFFIVYLKSSPTGSEGSDVCLIGCLQVEQELVQLLGEDRLATWLS